MPSAGQLMRSRRRFEQLLPDRALIERPTVGPDGSGGQTTTWAELADDVPCRLSPIGGGEDTATDRRGGDRITEDATSIISFRWDQDVTEADKVTIDGQAFDVQLVRRRGEYAMTLRCECREA